MATKAHARTASARSARASRPVKKTSSKRAVARKVESAPDNSALFTAREKKIAAIFGPLFPKGRLISPDGALVTPLAGCKLEFCLGQYAPKPDRMSWVYVTHGFSCACEQKNKSLPRTELLIQWRSRDPKVPVKVLTQTAKYILGTGHPVSAGEVLSKDQIGDCGVTEFQHWVVSAPEKSVPEKLELAPGTLRLLQLIGVTDAELQVALKVNPELADGRQVLLEALRTGGVFPVTDIQRTCLTRRRDFLRIWETAFRLVRERGKSNA
ncbi:MAG TPA: suppressor of fused domain protein [Planctomycetota bacterium]|nr:suppressor of fused domain protein [Planctomycetota bacterium]